MNRPDFRTRHYPVLGIITVHDGDTYRLLLDQGFEDAKFPWLRLKGYSCPENHEEGGPAARKAAVDILHHYAATLWVTTFKLPGFVDTRKTLTRYLADVFLDEKGTKLGEVLLAEGHAIVGTKIR